MKRGREAKIEFGCVDADENIRLQREHRASNARPKPQESRKVMQDLEKAHDREFLESARLSQPAAFMRGPATPTNRVPGARARRASIARRPGCLPRTRLRRDRS